MKIIFHIDVNSAFLSWTAVKRLREGSTLDIRKVPAVIGGDQETRHGIVVAKSIPAKRYGIRTAETIASARNKCPDLLIVPPEHQYYQKQSHKLMDLLRSYTPRIEQVSVDECYMDYSSIENSFDSPIVAAYHIKNHIRKELGFTVNIGISDVKVLAKMASDFEKPDKIHTLYRSEIQEKMWKLPVEDLFMAGKSSVETLHKLGIFTIGELAQSSVPVLESHLKSHGVLLWQFANGIDDSEVQPIREEAKGVGNSITLSKDYTKLEEIDKVLLQLSDKVAGRLRKLEQKGKTVAVEVKYNDFKKTSKQETFEKGVDSGTVIYESVRELFRENWSGKPVRLLGVRVTNLIDITEPEQLELNDFWEKETKEKKAGPSDEKLKQLDQALDQIKTKYGKSAIMRASMIEDQNNEENER